VRHDMHEIYKAYRADDQTALHKDFQKSFAKQLRETAFAEHGDTDLKRALRDRAGLETVQRHLSGEDAASVKNAMRVACIHGHAEAVPLLVTAGAELGYWPLFWASKCVDDDAGRMGVVHALLEAKSNPDASSYPDAPRDGYTGLWWAAYRGHVDMAEALIAAKADPTDTSQLHHAALKGHMDVVETLIGAKANPDASFTSGTTGLHCAAQNGHVDVVETLIRVKANPDACKRDGSTGLYHAAQNGHVNVVETLIRAKANLNASITDGCTGLFIAVRCGHVDIVEVLLNAKAAIDQENKKKQTPLNMASYQGNLSVVQLLVERKADVNTEDKWGDGPLQNAWAEGHDAVVEFLSSV